MSDCISYAKIPYYSDLIIDYLDQEKSLQPFYNRFPTIEHLGQQIVEKRHSYPRKNRDVLVSALKNQYKDLKISEKTAQNIKKLNDEKTFAITTGHQLNLFTGPLYFFYKIISVIKLTEQLKTNYPDHHFVPVFWMASEDHDFEEINYFNFKGQQVWWDSDQTGPVGQFSTDELGDVYRLFKSKLNKSTQAEELKTIFKSAYFDHDDLAEATRFLANVVFEAYGLVIIDGNDVDLKRHFIPYIKKELLDQNGFKKIRQQADQLDEMGYNVQVNPREINLFYINSDFRERVVEENGQYFVHNTDIQFSERELLRELDEHPERFSPNAVMRPLFQEVVLPNLCYIGGSGELAYWLELKAYFDDNDVAFPSLLLRNSALLISEKQNKKRQNLRLTIDDLFLEQEDLITAQTKRLSEIDIDFSAQKHYLEEQFNDLYQLAEKTDASFIGAVAAQEKKQKNGLRHLEKRLLKAQKRKLRDKVTRATALQDQLFPHKNLQERTANFSEFYETYGDRFLPILFEELNPLDGCFNVITL